MENSMDPRLQKAVIKIKKQQLELDELKKQINDPIAIIGMGCRFPGGANDLESFWKLLYEGADGISEVPLDRWDREAFYNSDLNVPGKMYTRHGGFLNRPIGEFDASFFGISPLEAEWMDPQQRLLLEVVWESLENAGIDPHSLKGTQTGVFIGLCTHDFLDILSHLISLEDLNLYANTGNNGSIVSGRISYLLGLKGPSETIDTACSSSLYSIHSACRSLSSGESNLALAGGVNIMLNPSINVVYCQAGVLAKDGHCKTFDAEADGYVRSEGSGVVVLKRLSDALRDGDHVFAIIKSTAVNQDGARSGLTVPNGESQALVINQALKKAKLESDAIDFIEAHGLGTPLGDPIEVRALSSVFGGSRKEAPLWIGTVKTNIGHLEAASGVAGVIKVVLSLNHEAIPAHINYKKKSPHFSFDSIPAKIPLSLTPWLRSKRPRIAGISSFGLSGTNAHAIIEEPPLLESRKSSVDRPWHILKVSAKSQEALDQLIDLYMTKLPDEELADIAFTANTGRAEFPFCAAVVAKDKAELISKLSSKSFKKGSITQPPILAFWFKGGQSNDLDHLRAYPVFQNAMTLSRGLYEYALFELYKSWGIVPDYVGGESTGEYIAAIASGIINLEDGLKLIEANDRPEEISEIARKIVHSEPKIGFFSSRTGVMVRRESLTPDYWIIRDSNQKFSIDNALVVSLDQLNWEDILEQIALFYLHGVKIDWKAFDRPFLRKKVFLPNYPFQRKHFWLDFIKKPNLENPKQAHQPIEIKQPILYLRLLEAQPNERKTIVQDFLNEILEKNLGLQLTPEQNFMDSGMDSIMSKILFERLQAGIGQMFKFSSVIAYEVPSINAMVSYFETHVFPLIGSEIVITNETPDFAEMVCIQPKGIHQPLFCIHAIDGDILDYFNISKTLGDDYPLYGIRIKNGLGIPDNFDEIASHYVELIRSVQPHGPYHLAGHSGGGILAAEMAFLLEKQNENVNFLACFDSPNIEDSKKTVGLFNPHALTMRSIYLKYGSKTQMTSLSLDNIQSASNIKTTLRMIYESLEKIINFPKGMTFEIFENRYNAYILLYHLLLQYFPKPFKMLEHVCLFNAKIGSYEALGYPLKVESRFEVAGAKLQEKFELNCDHFNIVESPHIEFISEVLKKYIAVKK